MFHVAIDVIGLQACRRGIQFRTGASTDIRLGLMAGRTTAQLVEEHGAHRRADLRSEEHTSELQSLMRISYAVFCLKKKRTTYINQKNKMTQCDKKNE